MILAPTGTERRPSIRLNGLPSSGVVMIEAFDDNLDYKQVINSNEFIEDFQFYNGFNARVTIEGIFETSSSGTFDLQMKKEDDDFDVTTESFIILTKIK